MNYCGIDLSKKSSHFCIMNEQREVLSEGKVANRIWVQIPLVQSMAARNTA